MNLKVANRITAAAGVLAFGAAVCLAVPAFAGSCPADKGGVDLRQDPHMAAKDVTDTVVTTLDVAKEPASIKGRRFRLRRLVVQPGGIVPWHSHGDRPAIIYIVSGEMTEYSSTCAEPIVHKAGESTPEMHDTSHWWKNTGKGVAVVLSADLLKVGDMMHMMM